VSPRKNRRTVAQFGARYGVGLRKRLVEVTVDLKRKHRCQKCDSVSVKRFNVAIWKCKKCGYTFTGGAYTPRTRLGEVALRSARRGS